MAIAMALQRGNMVYVYNERNVQLWCRSGELYGYTGSTVTIKQNHMLYMYDEKNIQRGMRAC